MKRILAGLVLASSLTMAIADWTASQDGDTVLLTETPCTDVGILKTLPPDLRKTYFSGEASVSGQRYALCWRDMGRAVHLVYADGDQGVIPKSELKKL